MGFKKGRKTGEKWCVQRHRSMPKEAADGLERVIERRTRREGQQQIEEALLELQGETEATHGKLCEKSARNYTMSFGA
jgi:hypothetical protein